MFSILKTRWPKFFTKTTLEKKIIFPIYGSCQLQSSSEMPLQWNFVTLVRCKLLRATRSHVFHFKTRWPKFFTKTTSEKNITFPVHGSLLRSNCVRNVVTMKFRNLGSMQLFTSYTLICFSSQKSLGQNFSQRQPWRKRWFFPIYGSLLGSKCLRNVVTMRFRNLG